MRSHLSDAFVDPKKVLQDTVPGFSTPASLVGGHPLAISASINIMCDANA